MHGHSDIYRVTHNGNSTRIKLTLLVAYMHSFAYSALRKSINNYQWLQSGGILRRFADFTIFISMEHVPLENAGKTDVFDAHWRASSRGIKFPNHVFACMCVVVWIADQAINSRICLYPHENRAKCTVNSYSSNNRSTPLELNSETIGFNGSNYFKWRSPTPPTPRDCVSIHRRSTVKIATDDAERVWTDGCLRFSHHRQLYICCVAKASHFIDFVRCYKLTHTHTHTIPDKNKWRWLFASTNRHTHKS